MCLVMHNSTLVCKNIAHAIICCNQERLFANNGWMQNEIFTQPICFDAKLMEAMSCQARSKWFSKECESIGYFFPQWSASYPQKQKHEFMHIFSIAKGLGFRVPWSFPPSAWN
jgi:hypothetical protein